MPPAPVRLRKLLAQLIEADVRFVLVGGLAVNAWGFLRSRRLPPSMSRPRTSISMASSSESARSST
jgi:hypothetical protein